jgi:hypothetical protein
MALTKVSAVPVCIGLALLDLFFTLIPILEKFIEELNG